MFASSGGYGLNLDILGSNAINIIVVIGILTYLGKNLIGNILSERKTSILAAIQEAEDKQKSVLSQIAQQKENIAKAQEEAEKIKRQAEETAKKLAADILNKAEQDIAKMQAASDRELASERDLAIVQLRRQVVLQALEQVEAELPNKLNDDVQSQLIDNSIQLLGG